MKKVEAAKLLFGFSCLTFVFALGFAVRHFKLFPYSLIETGIDSVRAVFSERQTLARTRPEQLTKPAHYPGKGVTRSQPGAAPGFTLVSSFFDGGNEIRLMRLDGSVVNRWPLKFFEIFPNR